MRLVSLFAMIFLIATKAHALTTPTNLVATATSSSRINLTWSDSNSNETGFKVYRAPDVSGAPGTFALIATLGVNANSYPNTGLNSGVKYWYRVTVYKGSQTATSANASATTLAPHHLNVTGFPGSVTAGVAGNVTVTSRDINNNLVSNFNGAVALSSSDPAAALPPTPTLTNGTGTFAVTLKTAGTRSITATAGAATGSQTGITVAAASAASLAVTLTSANSNACEAATVSAMPYDAFGNVATSYNGTVGFTSSDTAAILPANSALTGAGASYGVTMKTLGAQWVRLTDTSNATITGQVNLTVNPGSVNSFALAYPSAVTVGANQTLSVTAKDACNNTATSFTGPVTISSDTSANINVVFGSDPPLPQVRTVTAGSYNVNIRINNTGTHYLYVVDSASHTGQTNPITVNPYVDPCACEASNTISCGQEYFNACYGYSCGTGTAPGGECPTSSYQCGETAYDYCGNACGTGTGGGGNCDTGGTACGQPVYDSCGNQCGTGTGPGGDCQTYNAPCGDAVTDQCGNYCGTGTGTNYNQCQPWNYCYWETVYDNCGNSCGSGQNSCGP